MGEPSAEDDPTGTASGSGHALLWLTLSAVGGLVLVFVGHTFLDAARPATGTAAVAFLAAAAVGAFALRRGWQGLQGSPRLLGLAGLGGLSLGWLLAASLPNCYGNLGFCPVVFAILGIVLVVGLGIAGPVGSGLRNGWDQVSTGPLLAAAFTVAVAATIAALYLLVTLPDQAARARRANRAPALPTLTFLLATTLAALWHRRRR